MFKYYQLQVGNDSELTFKGFIEEFIFRENNRLTFYRVLYKFRIKRILIVYIAFSSFLFYRAFFNGVICSYNEFLFFSILSVISCISLVLTPTNNVIITQNEFLDYLNELITDDKKRSETLKLITNYEFEPFALIKINLTRNELTASIAQHLKTNIIELRGITQRRLCKIIEENSCDSEGKKYIQLDKLLSNFKTDLRDSDKAFKSYLNKLDQDTLK